MEGQVYKFEVSRRKTGDLALEPIKNGQQACEFCFKHLNGLIEEWRETSAAIYLDKENRALGYEIISEGTADACLFDTKQLIRSACLVGANSVIVAHNHPSGNARPSKLDIEQAEKIRRGLHAAGLILLDFVILTESGEGYTMCDELVIKCEKTPEKTEKESKCANVWKPSQVQIVALRCGLYNCKNEPWYNILVSLYNDLQKLL